MRSASGKLFEQHAVRSWSEGIGGGASVGSHKMSRREERGLSGPSGPSEAHVYRERRRAGRCVPSGTIPYSAGSVPTVLHLAQNSGTGKCTGIGKSEQNTTM